MSEWLRDSLSFCRTYWWAIVAIVVPVAIMREFLLANLGWYEMGTGASTELSTLLTAIGVIVIFESFIQIKLILLVQGVLAKQNLSFSQRSSRALVALLPFIFMQILISFGVMAGLLAFILPGIYVFVRWVLAPYFLLIQGQGGLASLKSSWKFSRGYTWDLFFGLLITALVSAIPTLFILNGASGGNVILSNAVLSILSSILSAWSVVLFYRAYDYVQSNPRFID
ncbi:MAG TPA: hypothetical protein DE276_05125 [Oceanospirillaceae bacterium]|nr:hypothetical protein [Oceanospirillaceae bacterium]